MRVIFKNKRNILIMMFALVLIMGIGFAAYSQQLQINDTSSIDSDWNVYIKDIDSNTTNGGATGSGAVDETTRLKADLTTDLKYPGDYVIYKITVANDGTIDAILEKINFSMSKENTVIKYYYSVDDMATWNEVTKSGENPYNVDLLTNTTDEFQVKVEYDPTKTGTATEDQKSNKLTFNLDYVQKESNKPIVQSVPQCTWSNAIGETQNGYINGYISEGQTLNYNLTCVDEVNEIEEMSLIADNFTISDAAVASITSISEPNPIENGYKWTVETTAGSKTGVATLSLNEGIIQNNIGNTNEKIISNSMKTDNEAPTCGEITKSTEAWAKSVTVTAPCNDNKSGCETAGSKTYTTKCSANCSLTIKDRLGNSRTCSGYTVGNVESPTEIVVSNKRTLGGFQSCIGTTWYDYKYTFTITAPSGVAGGSIQIGNQIAKYATNANIGGTACFTSEKVWDVYRGSDTKMIVTVKTKAGNTKTFSFYTN